MRQGEGYITPNDTTFLTDNSAETCTIFQADEHSDIPQYTTFRVVVLDEKVEYLNFTLLGVNLTCSGNLFVMPLTVQQTINWSGIWATCHLIDSGVENLSERCIFSCRCLGGCREIQVIKRPRNVEESTWSLCHLSISYPTTTGSFIIIIDNWSHLLIIVILISLVPFSAA